MFVFYVLLLVPIAVQHFRVGNRRVDYEKKNKLALLLFFVGITILVGLRHMTIGIDTRNYANYFLYCLDKTWADTGSLSNEFGFYYLNKFVSLFTKSYQVFFVLVSIATFGMIYPTYRRLCKDPCLMIVLFCNMSTFVMAFSGIRQMIAIGIGFIAYEFTRKKKLIPFILMVLLAMTFHTSAFMLAFMYPLYHVRITRKWLLVIVPILAVIFAFNQQIFTSLAWILEEYVGYDASITETGAFTMLILFAIFAVFVFVIPDETLLDEETIGLRNFLIMAVALQMFAPLHTIAMRMNYYYIIFIPLLVPKIIEARSKTWSQVAIMGRHVMVGFFLVYFFYNAYTGTNNLHVFPYHFFWEAV